MKARVIASAIVGALIVGLFVGYYAYAFRIRATFGEAEEVAERVVSDDLAEAWPPHDEEVVTEREVETERPSEPSVDTLPALPESTAEFKIRDGQWENIVYLEAIFGDASFDERLATIVVLHGRGGRAHIPGGPIAGLSHPVRVIVPQAPDPLGNGFEWLPVYVGQGLVDRLSSTLFASSTHVANMLRHFADESLLVRGKPIVTGFSQGGIMTLALALFHDDVVGEALPMACWLPPPLEPSYQRWDLDYAPIRSLHGLADETIPFAPTEAMFERLGELGFDVELQGVAGVGHEMTENMNFVFHEWLDAAVCRTVGDTECEARAVERANALRYFDWDVADNTPDVLLDTPDAFVDTPDAFLDTLEEDASPIDAMAEDAPDAASNPDVDTEVIVDEPETSMLDREVEFSPGVSTPPSLLPGLELDLAGLEMISAEDESPMDSPGSNENPPEEDPAGSEVSLETPDFVLTPPM